MVIGTRSDNENCSIGLIAGPDSAATSSSPPSPSPPDGAAARLYPGRSRQTSANCANYVAGGPRLGEGTRITFHTPAAPPSRKNTIVNAGLVFSAQSRPQPIAPPTRIAATNSLPARRPIDIPEARLSGGLDEFGRGDAAASGRCAFSLPESASSRARSAGSSSGGSFSLGIRPLSWRGARRCVGSLVEEISRRVNRLAAPWPPGFASLMRAFRACPALDGRRLGGLPWIEISQSLEGQNSLVVGKNAGNFAELAPFCENPSRKHLRIQAFADEFPTRCICPATRRFRVGSEGAASPLSVRPRSVPPNPPPRRARAAWLRPTIRRREIA